MGGWHRVGFPRATRGWKEKARALNLKDAVSPALRGDGSPCPPTQRITFSFPPRYAGMEEGWWGTQGRH